MRIVSGIYGGRILKSPKDGSIRPTSDKVRGAIFNALRARGGVEGAHVLDVFCGTGALGLEALSQGAASCLFVDSSRESLALARDNAETLQVEAADFLQKKAENLPQRMTSQNVAGFVFLDPPYGQGLLGPALQALAEGGWIDDETILVAELSRNEKLDLPDGFAMENDKIYGDTRILYLRYTASAPE